MQAHKFVLAIEGVARKNIASSESLDLFAYCFICSFHRFLILVPRVICFSWPAGVWDEEKVI